MTLRDVSNGPDWILWVVCYLHPYFGVGNRYGHTACLFCIYHADSYSC